MICVGEKPVLLLAKNNRIQKNVMIGEKQSYQQMLCDISVSSFYGFPLSDFSPLPFGVQKMGLSSLKISDFGMFDLKTLSKYHNGYTT